MKRTEAQSDHQSPRDSHWRSESGCAFYERAKKAYCVIQTGERRFYGCFAFRKGVVPPDAE